VDIQVVLGEAVRLADGPVLVTDIYRPRGRGPYPTVLLRSPYKTRSLFHLRLARRLAALGFNVVVQAVRGTGESTGTFGGIQQEAGDTPQVVEWLASRRWFDGSVCPMGLSYSSYVAWLAAEDARRRGIEVHCLVNLLGGLSLPFREGGALVLHWALSWAVMMGSRSQGPALHRRLSGDPGLYRHLSLERLDLGNPTSNAIWQSFLENRPVQPIDIAAVGGIPALTITGWYDLTLDAACETHHRLTQGRADSPHALVVGPWDHAQPLADMGRELAGGEPGHRIGPHGSLLSLVTDWFTCHAGGGSPGTPAGAWYYVTGEDVWRHRRQADDGRALTLHLAGGMSETRRHLAPDRPAAGRAVFRHDPLNPVPTTGGNLWPLSGHFQPGAADQSGLEGRGDVLFYDSEPLSDPLTVLGDGLVELEAAVSVASADITVKLVDVHPDGRAILVRDTIRRLKTRPDTPQRLRLPLRPLAHRFASGHRIRLEVAGSNFPKYDRALDWCEGRPAVGEFRVWEGGEAGSRLILPQA